MTRGSAHGLTTPRRTDWRDQGLCRNHDQPDLWYASDADQAAVAQAVSICVTCPVVQECAQAAFARREPHGIWGGMTARQRTYALRKARERRAAQLSKAA